MSDDRILALSQLNHQDQQTINTSAPAFNLVELIDSASSPEELNDKLTILKKSSKSNHHMVNQITTLQTIILSKLIENTRVKEKIFRDMLIHPLIKKINGKGLMLALIMDSEKSAQSLVKIALENGVILFFLLFESKAVRITPPLIISESQVREACKIIINCLNKIKC